MGLLIAIDEMGRIILSFGGDNIDLAEIMTGFSGPLGGMAIGFSSSLFGVLSAIILNLIQLYFNKKKKKTHFRRCSRMDEREDYWFSGIDIIEDTGIIKL